jgi:hypothetical protein
VKSSQQLRAAYRVAVGAQARNGAHVASAPVRKVPGTVALAALEGSTDCLLGQHLPVLPKNGGSRDVDDLTKTQMLIARNE